MTFIYIKTGIKLLKIRKRKLNIKQEEKAKNKCNIQFNIDTLSTKMLYNKL